MAKILIGLVAHSYCTRPEPGLEQVQGIKLGAIGPNKLYTNVHTGPRRSKEPGPIVSVMLVQFSVPVPIPCNINKSLDQFRAATLTLGVNSA